MAFPTYTSSVTQTIRRVSHPDGVESVYVFNAGGVAALYTSSLLATSAGLLTQGTTDPPTYTVVSQEEAWIFEELARDYQLVVV